MTHVESPKAKDDVDIDDDEFGTAIEFDQELETILVAAETQHGTAPAVIAPADIEDIIPEDPRSPFEQFRRKGWLSVSDLVGTIWCEVQYDYRLRTLPYLPPSQRPTVITSKEGVPIPVDKIKVEGKERILRRGEKIHKRLEREIHPEEIVVHAVTRGDVWGLRFLNMFSALEALLTLGKCRELPVVGFVRGILVMGIIDEITRHPVDESSSTRSTRSSAPDKSQTALTSFFSPSKPRAAPVSKPRTHKLFVSDSKTRASGTVPKESDTLAGRFQVMLYKELLDALLLPSRPDAIVPSSSQEAILPTETPFSWQRLFDHLNLNMDEQFSESFVIQSRPIIIRNGLRYGVDSARTLSDMVSCWTAYVDSLGLGTPADNKKETEPNTGRTDDRLELVYRRAGARDKKSTKPTTETRQKGRRSSRRKGKRKVDGDIEEPPLDKVDMPLDEDEQLQLAIAESLKPTTADVIETTISLAPITTDVNAKVEPDGDAEEDELAWAVEMSLGAGTQELVAEEDGEVILRGSQVSAYRPSSPGRSSTSAPSTPSPQSSPMPSSSPPPSGEVSTQVAPQSVTIEELGNGKSKAGSIIGRSVFTHSPRRLVAHLSSVLSWWMGEREAVGVSIEETRRCGWCEFEEGCEWRSRKAEEALERARKARQTSG